MRLIIALALVVYPAAGQSLKQLSTRVPLPAGDTLVIGFVGGLHKWDDDERGVRRLVLRLREINGVHGESMSHLREEVARAFIVKALDTDGDGELSDTEKSQARIILFGQSLGGSETVGTARWLADRGVPVLLTVQIDSVGLRDGVIPSNVRAAANLFQHERWTFRGEPSIRAADPARTKIIGSFPYEYKDRPLVDPNPGTWVRQTIGGGHAKMELDPEVWSRVESLILDALKE